MVEVPSDEINASIDGRGNTALWNPNLRVKCLKFDNGGEYNSREFIEYCAENGIRMLKTGSQRCFGKIQLLWQLYLINREPFVPLGFQIPELEWQGKEVSLAHLRVFGCDSYVKVKDVARDKLDANPGGSLDTSEGSENSRSFEDSGRSNKEDSKDEAFSEKGGSETPQVRRSTRESMALVRYSPSANYLILTENGEPEFYSEALSSKESVQ
ncbi:retrovirus-related pol polyprotein from transposon TNT 1-94 [Tanacetum coccineum]